MIMLLLVTMLVVTAQCRRRRGLSGSLRVGSNFAVLPQALSEAQKFRHTFRLEKEGPGTRHGTARAATNKRV